MFTTFADYAFYTAQGGRLSEAVYNSVVDDAHAEIILQTNGAANAAPDSMQDALKLCECRLADTIAAYREGAAALPKGVGSISNDGYTVSAGPDSGASTLEAEARECAAVCARYLQWPVNLMCRWV